MQEPSKKSLLTSLLKLLLRNRLGSREPGLAAAAPRGSRSARCRSPPGTGLWGPSAGRPHTGTGGAGTEREESRTSRGGSLGASTAAPAGRGGSAGGGRARLCRSPASLRRGRARVAAREATRLYPRRGTSRRLRPARGSSRRGSSPAAPARPSRPPPHLSRTRRDRPRPPPPAAPATMASRCSPRPAPDWQPSPPIVARAGGAQPIDFGGGTCWPLYKGRRWRPAVTGSCGPALCWCRCVTSACHDSRDVIAMT